MSPPPPPLDLVSDSNGVRRFLLSEPSGSSAEVSVRNGQVVSWKNDRREELLFVARKPNGSRSPASVSGGICISFPRAATLCSFEQHEYTEHRSWSIENDPPDQPPSGSPSSVHLVSRSSDKDSRTPACRFELRLNISISQGKLTLMPSVKNTGNKPFSFTFSMRNSLSVSDISEVRVEGLETLDYLDNMMGGRRFTEQADALTFDDNISRTYLNTPSKIAVIDHGRKRTFVVRKRGLDDCVVWNPGDNKGGKNRSIGNDYKTMVSLNLENPVVLKPFQVWAGFQEIGCVSSSYCSGQLDPNLVVQPFH